MIRNFIPNFQNGSGKKAKLTTKVTLYELTIILSTIGVNGPKTLLRNFGLFLKYQEILTRL